MTELRTALHADWRVELHSVPAPVFERLLSERHVTARRVRIAYDGIQRAKCSRRPAFYMCEELRCLFVAVMSGSDYVLHYASLLRHAALLLTDTQSSATAAAAAAIDPQVSVLSRLTVVLYPQMLRQVCSWTAFDPAVRHGDTVVYGYASDLLQYMQRTRWASSLLRHLSTFENDYYYSERTK